MSKNESVMSKEAMKLALEALVLTKHAVKLAGWEGDLSVEKAEEAIKALEEALAKQEQSTECVGEPVAWYDREIDCAYTNAELDGGEKNGLEPLYTTPYVPTGRQQRKPLTDEQIQNVMTKAVQEQKVSWAGYKQDCLGRFTIPSLSPYHFQMVRAIEAYLKEKNT